MNRFSLEGKTAVVTGASRGLGASAAEALAEAGADVALIGRELPTLRPVANRLESEYGVKAFPVRCDVSSPRQVSSAVSRIRKRFDRIDVLVNNAGIIRRWPASDYPLEDWNDVLDVNLTGLFLMAQHVGRAMVERGEGKIINVASLLSFSGGKNVIAYTASKHGVAGVTRALANEWAESNVQVNAIAPGYFETDATEALRKDRRRKRELTDRIPAGRWGNGEDLKGTIIFLASPASDYVTGQVIAVDGGWLAA